MKNKIVTLLCILAILITTAVITLADERTKMAFNEGSNIKFELDQMIEGHVNTDPDHVEWLYPMIGAISDSAAATRIINGHEYIFATNPNVKDQIVTVKNKPINGTDGEPVFVRTVFAFETGGLKLSEFHEFMHININASNGDYISPWTWLDNGKWVYAKLGSEEYFVTTATYKTALGADETTAPSLLQIGLLSGVSSDTAAKFGNDGFKFIIKTQAVQAVGATDESFSEITSRLDGAFGEISESNNTWINNVFTDN